MKEVRSRSSNYCVLQKRAQIESKKKHNNISIEEILNLCF